MVCPKCNSQYADNLPACPFCSAAAQAPQQAPFQVPQGAAEFAPPPAPVKKKSKAGKIIPIVIAAIFVVLGIASTIMNNKEATHTFTYTETDEYYVVDTEYTVKCKGDTITEITVISETEFVDIDEEYVAEFYEEYVQEQQELYADYDFITFSCEIDGINVIEKIIISDASDHVSELEDLDILEDGGDGDFISYEQTKENLIDDGFELKE